MVRDSGLVAEKEGRRSDRLLEIPAYSRLSLSLFQRPSCHGPAPPAAHAAPAHSSPLLSRPSVYHFFPTPNCQSQCPRLHRLSRCQGIFSTPSSHQLPIHYPCLDEMRRSRGWPAAMPALQAQQSPVRAQILTVVFLPISAHLSSSVRCVFEKHRRGRKPGSKSVWTFCWVCQRAQQ